LIAQISNDYQCKLFIQVIKFFTCYGLITSIMSLTSARQRYGKD